MAADHAELADVDRELTDVLLAPPPSFWEQLMQDDEDPVAPEVLSLVGREEAPRRIGAALRQLFDSAGGCLHHLVVTAGAGKSRAAAKAVAVMPVPFVVLVPTHALATEYETMLAAHGVTDVHVQRGLTGLRVDGQHACLQRSRAQSLIAAGVDPAEALCGGCPHRLNHPLVSGGPCPAYQTRVAPSGPSRVRVLQSTRADAIIERLMDVHFPRAPFVEGNVESDEDEPVQPPPAPVLILDEPGDLMLTTSLSAGHCDEVRRYLSQLELSVRERLEGIVLPVLEAIEARTIEDGASIHDVLTRQARLDEASTGGILRGAWACRRLGLSSEAVGELSMRGDLEAARRSRELLTLLREAAFEPRRPCVSVQGSQIYFASRAPWVRQLRSWVLRGGRAAVLDATGNPAEFRALGVSERRATGRVDFRVTEVHVADAPGVRRVFIKWGSGAKSRHVDASSKPVEKELQGVLREVARIAREQGGPVGLLAHKPVALALQHEVDALRAEIAYSSSLVPSELAALVRDGIELQIGWYGAHRGLNRWEGVAVLVTLGDPNPNLGKVHAEATALGWNPEARSARLREAERNQASGRARPIWGTPRSIVHVGNHKPVARWAPQWEEVETVTLKQGRPERSLAEGISAADHEARRLQLGLSKRAYAKSIGEPLATYLRRTKSVEEDRSAPRRKAPASGEPGHAVALLTSPRSAVSTMPLRGKSAPTNQHRIEQMVAVGVRTRFALSKGTLVIELGAPEPRPDEGLQVPVRVWEGR